VAVSPIAGTKTGAPLSFLASDRLARRSIQFAAGVGEATSPEVRSTATPEQRLVETAQGPTAMGGAASDDGTDVSNCRPPTSNLETPN
jgi:hypothetical protein